MRRLRSSLAFALGAAAVALAAATSLLAQANIPSSRPPEITSLSPGLKNAIDELQRQCPTCATIDVATGRKTWLLTAGQPQSQIPEILVLDGCQLPPWARAQSASLRTALEKTFGGADLKAFVSHVPKDCDQKAFVYYIDVARQALGKVTPQ